MIPIIVILLACFLTCKCRCIHKKRIAVAHAAVFPIRASVIFRLTVLSHCHFSMTTITHSCLHPLSPRTFKVYYSDERTLHTIKL